MKMNIKNKKTIYFSLGLFFLLGFFVFTGKAQAVQCRCGDSGYTGGIFGYDPVGQDVDVPCENVCVYTCNQRTGQNADSYFYYAANNNSWRLLANPAATPSATCPAAATPTASNPFLYTPLEEIPGQPAPPRDFYEYVSYVYKFGIGVVGIAALFMITVGGFMYITSAGNNARMEAAKGVITDAIAGLVLALAAYLILYTINPELVRLRPITAPAPAGAVAPTPTPAPTAGIATNPNNLSCPFPSPNNNINQATFNVCTPLTRSTCNPTACNIYSSLFNQYVNGAATLALLKTFMVVESSCDINAGTATSYGLMQLSPATVMSNPSVMAQCGVPAGTIINRTWLTASANAGTTICLAAGIINSLTGVCGTNPARLYAGYNGGPGVCTTASVDCASDQSCFGGTMTRWECPFDNNKTTCNTGYTQTRQGAGYVNYCLTRIGF
jgi:hypothetical protein